MRTAKAIFRLLRETFAEWVEDRVPRLGAALAYYTIFALAPLIIIATLVAGSLWGGQQFAQDRLVAQISQFAGNDAATLVNELVNAARLPRSAGAVSITIGVVGLLLGGLGVFGQLQDAFDTIWEVTPNPRINLFRLMRNRLLSFLMLLVVGFLLLVSLIASTLLTAIGSYLQTRITNYSLFAPLLNGLLPLVFTAALFTIMFKVLPNVRLAWRDVMPGAVLTAVLFALAKYAIGFYLGSTRLGTSYGAAGSIIVILVWVYFSAQLLFFGAEFTQVYVKYYGHQRPVPSPDTLPVSEAERAKQGMPHKSAVDAMAARVESSEAQARKPLRLHWLGRHRARAGPSTPGVVGMFLSFVAGVGTGAVMAALAGRAGSQRG